MKGCLFWERKHERKKQRNLSNMLIASVFVIILIEKLLSLRGLLKLSCEVSVDPNSCMKAS